MTDTPTLQSTYAMDQLSRVATGASDLYFVQMLLPVFGLDMPVSRLQALRAAALEGALAQPAYQVNDSEGEPVGYDPATRTIGVSRAAIEAALGQPDATPRLLEALLEGFGQHLYTILNQEIAGQVEGDAPSAFEQSPEDLGARYAAMMIFMDEIPGEGVVFGDYTGGDSSGPLVLSASLITTPSGDRPSTRFVAGGGHPGHSNHSFGHESIEKVLMEVGFDADQAQRIYFGNWLRDHSQFVDAALVRVPGQPLAAPALFSRAALTQLVDFLALKKFHALQNTPDGRAAYTVTPEMLGVYRASEHIDNPTNTDENAADPRSKDPDFEPLVRLDHPANEVHPEYGRKNYFNGAVDYMVGKLEAAQETGMTPEGMRYLGEGLHVLEDLFAHSNFAELCLQKLGVHDVVTWTTEIANPGKDAHGHTLISGMFSSLDVLASISEPLAEVLFNTDALEFNPINPGERSDTEQMLLILLKDYPEPAPREALEAFLKTRDELLSKPHAHRLQQIRWLMSLPMNAISHAKNLVMKPLLKYLGDNIGNLQTLLDGNPNEDANVLATHSQLAKDHDTHCLHELAALLATDAVRTVGRAMHEYWHGNTQRNPAYLASSFFVHPGQLSWYSSIVKPWMEANPHPIEQACELNRLVAARKQYIHKASERLRQLDENRGYDLKLYNETVGRLSPFPF